jgi:hypothetical protein
VRELVLIFLSMSALTSINPMIGDIMLMPRVLSCDKFIHLRYLSQKLNLILRCFFLVNSLEVYAYKLLVTSGTHLLQLFYAE